MRTGRLEAVASWALADEIVEVLRRPSLGRYAITAEDVHDVVSLLAPLLPTVQVDAPVRDPDDAVVVATAVVAHAEVIVTGDGDLLEDIALQAWLRERLVDVVSPTELLART